MPQSAPGNHSDALPAGFVDRLRVIMPPEALNSTLASFRHDKATSFRINPLKAGDQDVVAGLELDRPPESVAWCEHAWWVDHQLRSRLTHSPAVSRGEIFVQGLSSVRATLVLDPQPGQKVLDLAAAPGGKATHMAALMNNQGWLSVVEPVQKRMFVLADNLKRAGVTIARTYLMDGRKAGGKVPGRFDRVMLDAPCSGEARFHASQPDRSRFWSLRKIREQARKQHGLIESAFQALKPGGQLLYGTCSFAPEENESIVDGLLKKFPDQARLLPVDLPDCNWQPGLLSFGDQLFDRQLSTARRILPDHLHDGFFLALICKYG